MENAHGGQESLGRITVAFGCHRIYYAKHVDSELLDQAVGAANQRADAADWRLSNFDLRQRTLEFTSELRAYAAG